MESKNVISRSEKNLKLDELHKFFCLFSSSSNACLEQSSKCNAISSISLVPMVELTQLPAEIVFKLWKNTAATKLEMEDFTFVVSLSEWPNPDLRAE
jgi:hypothetical protein